MKTMDKMHFALCAGLALLAGCNTATPASRANTMRVGDIKITFAEKTQNCTVTFGDGLLASADGEGDQTANPVQTMEIKPDTDIAVGGAKSNTKGAAASKAASAAAESKSAVEAENENQPSAKEETEGVKDGVVTSKIGGVPVYSSASALIDAIAAE